MNSFKKTSKVCVLVTALIITMSVTGYDAYSQAVGISSTAITPDASCIMELRTTNKGLLMPRMTQAQRDAITSPATGLIVYNTDANLFNYYNGTSWSNLATSATSGTVTSASVTTANGFAGTVATSTTTPAITISTSVNGIAKGNGTALSAATAGTDYSAGTSALATGILKSTTTTGALSIATAGDFPTLNQNTTGTSASITGNITESQVTNLVTDLAAKQAAGSYLVTTNNLSDVGSAATSRTNLGATTVGSNLFTLTNPSAITFPRFNADNSVSALDAATFRTAIGAGTSSATGTVTSVTSATADATVATTTTTPVITIVSAPKLTTGRTIGITGDITYTSPSFDGSANVTAAATLPVVNSNVGTFNSVTVNAKGLVTAATNTTTELTGKTNSDVNSTYPDNSTYWSNVTTANGFPVNGNLSGIRKGTFNGQRIQDQLNGSTYARAWIEGTTSWTAWTIYLDGNDFTAKGQMHLASGNNSVGVLSVGTDGQVLTADAASANGVKWGAVTGTGNVVLATSPTLTTPVLGIANATSLGITGTGGNGFLSLATQSATPAAIGAGTVLFSNANSKFSWRGSANTFVKTFDGSAATADRIYALPDAAGTIPVSASGNIALSATGNISFTGTLPIANGGTNSSAALNNNRVMISSGGAIVEGSALTNGQLYIGSTGAAPVPATLTAGNGITITNAAGAITIAETPTITQATATADVTTTSLTDVVLTGMTITPGAGDYLVFFTGSCENTNSLKQGTVSIYSNGVQIAASVNQAQGAAAYAFTVATNAYITGLTAGQAIDVRWKVLANTGTFHQRTLIVQKVK